jgi:ATP-dependent Lhr-like helicase
VAGEERWAAIEDAGRLRDALGASLPVGVPQAFLESVPDPLGDLVARYARNHGPFSVPAIAQWWGVGPAVALDALRRLVSAGRLVEGELLPTENGGGVHGLDYCDAEVLRTLRRRSLAALRAEVEPVPAVELARFLPLWQGVGGGLRGREGLVRAVEQLAGAIVPASALETLVLPSRVSGYSPALLDELTSTGEVLWRGHGSLPGDDGWVSLHLGDTAHLTLATPDEGDLTDTEQAILDALTGGGAYFFRTLSDAVRSTDDEALLGDLWSLVWSGRVSGDTLAPLRALLSGGRTAHRRSRTGPRSSRYAGRRGSLGTLSGQRGPGRPALPSRSGPPTGAGRWSLLPEAEPDPTVRSYAAAEVLLDRYGVVTRGSVVAEGVPGGFAGVYRVLAAAEESGRVRRGYFVESLGAAQFAGTGAVDRLRAGARPLGTADPDQTPPAAVVLAACDPANAYGAALPWPARPENDGEVEGRKGHQPGRKAGALVVLVDGALVLYVERGGRTLLSWSEDPRVLQSAADALALAVREGALGRITVEKADGGAVLGSDHPLAQALAGAGFHATPRGLRLRR